MLLMKRTSIITIFLFLFIAGVITGGLFAQQPDAGSEEPGFGLQAQMFRNLSKATSELPKHLSSIQEYQFTPGDVYTLTFNPGLGSDGRPLSNVTYPVELQPDFTLDIPILGKIDVSGMTLQELKTFVSSQLKQKMILQYVDFRLTAPAQFQVFIYGGVLSPGYILANPLIRVIDSIALAGGLKPGATYRQITILRNGSPIILDVSRFYSNADFSVNPPLQPGDQIFVPQADVICDISGMIYYPGAYELVEGETLKDLLNFAGNFRPGAESDSIEIVRMNDQGQRRLIEVSIGEADSFIMMMGDVVRIASASENREMITFEGAFYGKPTSGTQPIAAPRQPLRFEVPWYPGISLLSVLDQLGGPTPYAKQSENYLLLKKTGEKISVDIKTLWEKRDLNLDIELEPGDFFLLPITTLKVNVIGEVSTPGSYDHMNGLTVADYIMLAGGFNPDTANPNGIYQLSKGGDRTKISLIDEVTPEATILVTKNALRSADRTMNDVFITLGWITTIAVTITTIITAYNALSGLW